MLKIGDKIELTEECMKIVGTKKKYWKVEKVINMGKTPGITVEGKYWTIADCHFKKVEKGYNKIEKIKARMEKKR